MSAKRIEPFRALTLTRTASATCAGGRAAIRPDRRGASGRTLRSQSVQYRSAGTEARSRPLCSFSGDPREMARRRYSARRPAPRDLLVYPALRSWGPPNEAQRIRGACPAGNFAQGLILPHEKTFPAAKADRLKLLTRAQYQRQPDLWAVCRQAPATLDSLIASKSPRARPSPMWSTISESSTNSARSTRPTKSQSCRARWSPAILIADGHHRYETALEYRELRRNAEGNPAPLRGYDYMMMTLVARDSPGLVILPTHRLVKHLDVSGIASFEGRAREVFEVEGF